MDRDRTPHESDRAPEATALERGPWMLALTGRIVGAAIVVGTLSLFARETMRTHRLAPPIRASATGLDPGVAFVPSVARTAALPSPGPKAGRLRLALEGADAVRIEPAHGPGQDTIGRGDFSAIEAPHLRLTLMRAAMPPTPSLFVTLARRAAEGLNLSVVRTGPRGRIETKFGPVETLEVTLAGRSRRICTGFTTLEALPVRLDGWLCAPLGRPPEPRTLACTLDALSLDAGADPGTDAVFSAAERRRDPGCRSLRALSANEPEGRTGSIGPKRAASRTTKRGELGP